MGTVDKQGGAPSSITPAMFSILVALGEEAMHGYAILQAIEKLHDGADLVGPTTLYRSIRQMLDLGLIAEVGGRPSPSDDERRRYYRRTASGRSAANAEANRLERLLTIARTTRGLRRRTA